MSLLSWNCHGLGTPWAFQFLKEITLQKRPDFVFLCEIICKKKTVERLQRAIGFEGLFVVESHGHSGGVAFLWRNKEDVVLKSYSKNHVDTIIHMNNSNLFRVTGVYGEPDKSKRHETWELIRNLSINNNHPWVLIGDMNNVCSQDDKKGGRPYPVSLIQGFLLALDECSLMDLDLQGYQYTWERGVGTSDWIEVRLDLALVTSEFMNMFKDATLTNLEVSTSNHCPLLLEFYKAQQVILNRSFRFENAWLREPMCVSFRIGNGQEVDILNSPWLPSIEDPFVHSNNEAISKQKVASLFRIEWLQLVFEQVNKNDICIQCNSAASIGPVSYWPILPK
ncbi:Endo/exonuclease/phosphatase domain-containing protein [Heracleum sosnowskyi]|uniref:Endo/exonuclease/phosphatase domain-containing protein n=1 Tax=Heracleum sosnowskyi TaxID=360622 RepID=A0AAD8MF18_9APIA|nr:Endo/exonuclease/phosphatase domain-containing protein [Heracleum sosnowskyi]